MSRRKRFPRRIEWQGSPVNSVSHQKQPHYGKKCEYTFTPENKLLGQIHASKHKTQNNKFQENRNITERVTSGRTMNFINGKKTTFGHLGQSDKMYQEQAGAHRQNCKRVKSF